MPRAGVPHAAHLHNILGRAQRHLARLIPDIEGRLLTVGGVAADVAEDTSVFEFGVRMPQRSLGLRLWSLSRSGVEALIWEELRPHLGGLLDVRTGRVVGLDRASGGNRDEMAGSGHVRGVRVDIVDTPHVIAADVIVDAMGGRSPMTRWLAEGSEAPEREVLRLRQWYATSAVNLGSRAPSERHFWLSFPTSPRTRGALLSPTGHGMWKVSVNGVGADPMPRTVTELKDYVASLEDVELVDLLNGGGEVSDDLVWDPPVAFAKPTAHWVRWDRAGDSTPIFAVGDSVASLNPLFGQGLSGALWEVEWASAAIAKWHGGEQSLEASIAAYREESGEIRAAMWRLMNVFEPDLGEGLSERDLTAIVGKVIEDPGAHRRLVETWHLLRSVDTFHELAGQGVSPETVSGLWA